MSTTALMPPDLLAMMARGVSVNVASRDRALRPSVMRAVGLSFAFDHGAAPDALHKGRKSRNAGLRPPLGIA
jgi:hypothetical protein